MFTLMRIGSLIAADPVLVSGLDCGPRAADNGRMEIPGRVENGVVVLEGETRLPDGAAVTVLYPRVRVWRKPGKKKPVTFPLVRSKHPGSLQLNNDRIAEILQEEDVRVYSKSFRKRRKS